MSIECRSMLCFCVFAVLCSIWFGYGTIVLLSDSPIETDAAQNARIAYHLVHSGTWGYDQVETPNPRPTMRREPVPILAVAALLLLHPSFSEPYKIVDVVDGRLTREVKLVNVFWRFLVAFFIFLLCRELFASLITATVVAVVTLAISDMTFLSPVADRLMTELPAAALLLAASWCAVRFVRDQTKSRAIWLGVSIGLLALTKAAFFNIGVIFVLLLFLPERLRLIRMPEPRSLRQLRVTYAILVAAFLATLAPWVIRNVLSVGNFGIVNRAEDILGLRLLLTEEAPLGMVYASSPVPLRQLLGPRLGYSEADLAEGGRLAGITFVKQRRADIYKTRMEAEGYRGDTKAWIRKSAVLSLVDHPLRYLLSIGIFAYRGMWFMQPSGQAAQLNPMTFCALSAISVLCLLGLFLGGLAARNEVLIAGFGLPAGAFIFHSALTHAIPRYNGPLTPFAIIAVLWLVVGLAQILVTRLRTAPD